MMEKKTEQIAATEGNDRRAFLSKVGKASLGIPATALLVSVGQKRAKAQAAGGSVIIDQEPV